jgi:hypothetical protein
LKTLKNLTEAELERLAELAAAEGRSCGEAAASWFFDGNTPVEAYQRVLTGIEDGDPEILDALPAPRLSGEWAGDPTPASLVEACGVKAEDWEPDALSWLTDNLCDAWEDACWSAVQTEVERAAREALA